MSEEQVRLNIKTSLKTPHPSKLKNQTKAYTDIEIQITVTFDIKEIILIPKIPTHGHAFKVAKLQKSVSPKYSPNKYSRINTDKSKRW
jgi:hypothetical protein